MEENASVLGQQLYGLDRDTLAALAMALCAQLTEYGTYHGGVRPENILYDGPDSVTLGAPANRETTGDWTPAELEYMAPEVFWNGTRTAAADVYSVGMLLYAGVTGGQMPFCPAEATPADRDEALRRRMNGELPEMPKTAGKHLARIIERSIQFRADDRYETPAALGAALAQYREALHSNIPAAREMFEKPRQELTEVEQMLLSILNEKAAKEEADRLAAERAAAEEAERLKAERQAALEAERQLQEQAEAEAETDSAPEDALAPEVEMPETEPAESAKTPTEEDSELQKAGKKAGLDPALVEAISASVAARMADPDSEETTEKETTAAERSELHKAEEDRISQQLEEMDWFGHNKDDDKKGRSGWIVALLCIVAIVLGALIIHSIGTIGQHRQEVVAQQPGGSEELLASAAPDASAAPEESTAPVETEEPTPTPTATPAPHRYEVILSNASWENAKKEAEAKGGYLAVIESGEELMKITELAAGQGARYVWIGLSRTSTGELSWVKSTDNGYISWAAGEPSVHDSYTGMAEDYVLLANQSGTWLYNDCIGDPAGSYPRFYSGVLAYVIEYDS